MKKIFKNFMHDFNFISKSKISPSLLCGILLSYLFFFSPILNTSLYSDDFAWWIFEGTLIQRGYDSVFNYMRDTYGLYTDGRLYPLTFPSLGYLWVLVKGNVFLAKIFILFQIFLIHFLMYKIITKLSIKSNAAILYLAISPIFFQIRFYHDPVITVIPWITTSYLFIVTHLYFLIEDTHDKKAYLKKFLSISFFILSLLISEIGFITPILTFLILYSSIKNYRMAIKSFSTYFIIFLIYMFTYIAIYINNGSYGGASLNLNDIDIILNRLIINIWAGFPLSYWISDPQHLYSSVNRLSHPIHYVNYFLAFLIFYNLWSRIKWKIRPSIPSIEISSLLLIALCFITAPALMVSVSAKYQHWINDYGMGYLPVFGEYIGYTLLVSLILATFVRKKISFLVIGLFFSFIASLTFYANTVSSNASQVGSYDSKRYNFIELFETNFFDEIQENSTILVNYQWPWLRPQIFNKYLNKNINIKGTSGLYSVIYNQLIKTEVNNSDHIYKLIYVPSSANCHALHHRECGYFVLSEITGQSNNKIEEKNIKIAGFLPSTTVSGYGWKDWIDNPVNPDLYSKSPKLKYYDMETNSNIIQDTELNIHNKNNKIIYLWANREDTFYNLQIIEPSQLNINHSIALKHEIISDNLYQIVPDDSKDSNSKIYALNTLFNPKNNSFIFKNSGLDSIVFERKNNGVGNNPEQLTINFKIKPTKFNNVSTILSNHLNFKGFTIEKIESSQNTFTFGIGNGSRWINAGEFDLEINQLYHFSININKNSISLDINYPDNSKKSFYSDNLLIGNENIFLGNTVNNKIGTQYVGLISDIEVRY